MMKLFAELKRRQMFRVAAAYAVVAWLLLQVVNNVAPALRLPEWAPTFVVGLLIIGFPVALLFCWIQQLAPAGAPESIKTNKLDWVLAGGLILVIALVSYQQLAPRTGGGTAPANAGGISIAVLPFANVSGDASREFFSDGMTDEISGALAKVPDLRVIARSSAFQFKGQNQDVRAVGLALGASHLIEGSVRQAGNRVRITAQLVRAGDGVQLWSENYDRELSDIFAIQEEIAQAIAGALRVPLGLSQGGTLVRSRTDDLQSYQQYLLARSQFRARGTGVTQAVAILESVVVQNPNFAPAWALLARAYAVEPLYSGESAEVSRPTREAVQAKFEMAARRALQIDPENATAYGALAFLEFQRGKWSQGEELYRRALEFDPNDPDLLLSYIRFVRATGRLKEALAVGERLHMLEPFVPIYNIVRAGTMQDNGQSAASIPILEALPADVAGGFFRNQLLSRAYAAAGRYSDAADTLLLITGDQVARKSVEDAAQLLRQAPAKVSAPEALPRFDSELNFVYAHVGALDRVMEFPERDAEIGNLISTGIYALWFPQYAPLRRTDRFKAFTRKIGLVDYWRARGWPDLCRPTGADDFVCD